MNNPKPDFEMVKDLKVNNPAQRAGLLKKFKTTSSSNTFAQGVVEYLLE